MSTSLPKKILIVDDEPNILLSLDYLLKKKGFTVFIARNGSEALELVRKESPNIMLLDIMMPDVNGYEVCHATKNSPDTKDVKIVFLSAKTKAEDIEKGYSMGADLYITKPFSTRELIKQVNELLLTVKS